MADGLRSGHENTISLIVPVYNVETWLGQCLESIVNQSEKFDEVILINDGSTDKSLEICKRYEKAYGYFKLISQPNAGLSAARNAGMALATGEYLMFLDSDDWLDKDTVATLKQIMENNRELDAIYFDADVFKDEGAGQCKIPRYDRHLILEAGRVMDGWEYFKSVYPRYYVMSACLAVYRRNNIVGEGMEFPPGIFYEDNYFSFMFLKSAKKVIYINRKLYQRRLRGGSITTGAYTEKKFISHITCFSSMWDEIMKEGRDAMLQQKAVLRHMVNEHCGIILSYYQLCKDKKTGLSPHTENFLKQAIRKYFQVQDYLGCDYETKGFSNGELAKNLVRIYQWKLHGGAGERIGISNIISNQRESYIEILKKIPLGRPDLKIGVYGTGKHTDGLLLFYESLIGRINCKLQFIDSEKESGTYRGYDVINYRMVDGSFDAVIISSFLYELEMMEKMKEAGKNILLYTFYSKIAVDLFSDYETWIERFYNADCQNLQ